MQVAEYGLRQAVVLAAGRGTRMKSLTEDCPKPMLPLAGRPMLAHQLDRFGEAGIGRVCFVIGYKGHVVREYFDEHPPAGMEVHYAVQEKADGTGSAALLARDFAGDQPFLLTFGDNLVDADVYRTLFKIAPDADLVLTLKTVDDPYRGGAVYVSGNRVVRIVEKPPKGESSTNFISAGVYVFGSGFFKRLEDLEPSYRGEYEITDAIQAAVTGGETVLAHEITGFWRDVGRPEDLAPASAYVEQA